MQERLSQAPVWLVLIVGVWVVPSVGIFVESFRDRDAHAQSGFWTAFERPGELTSSNYRVVLEGSGAFGLGDSLISAVAIVVPATLVPVALAATAAYAFAFFEFRGRGWLFVASVTLMALPVQMTLVPLLATFSSGAHFSLPFTDRTITLVPDVNFLGTTATWITQAAVALPFAVFLLHNAFRAIPRELVDAARIDGASHVDVLARIVLPVARPSVLSLIVLQFIWNWNDFLVPQVMTSGSSPDNLPVTVRLAAIVGEPSGAGPIAAAAVLVQGAIPLLTFVLFQRHIARGLVTNPR